jgi:hypothetical protein
MNTDGNEIPMFRGFPYFMDSDYSKNVELRQIETLQ